MIKDEIDRVSGINIGAGKANNDFLEASGSTALKTAATLAELIRRPELDYASVAPLDPDRKPLPYDVINQVEISIKYEGYIKRQMSQVEKVLKLENKKIPEDIDYREIHGLRIEAMQKLEKIRPFSIGQASRISGVSPADISVLLIYMTQYGRKDRETV
jgi:tRNA uridine 5-carboxymethylaminomethyl modification enzyme